MLSTLVFKDLASSLYFSISTLTSEWVYASFPFQFLSFVPGSLIWLFPQIPLLPQLFFFFLFISLFPGNQISTGTPPSTVIQNVILTSSTESRNPDLDHSPEDAVITWCSATLMGLDLESFISCILFAPNIIFFYCPYLACQPLCGLILESATHFKLHLSCHVLNRIICPKMSTHHQPHSV